MVFRFRFVSVVTDGPKRKKSRGDGSDVRETTTTLSYNAELSSKSDPESYLPERGRRAAVYAC